MAYVVKDARGRSPFWQAVYWNTEGRRVRKSTKLTSKSKALEFAMALQRAENLGKDHMLTERRLRDLLSETLERVTGERLRVFTVEQWLSQFVHQKQKSRADKTALRHEQMMKEFVEFLGPRARLNIAAINSKDIANFRDHRQSRGLSPATLNGDIAVLSAAFNAALRQGHINFNPCLALEKVKDDPSVRKATFTLAEVAALGKVASGDWRGLILTAFYTGQRFGDCANVKWSQVDLDSATRLIRFQPGKTGGEVVVPVNPVLAKFLVRLAKSKADQVYLFPTLANRDVSLLSKTFRKLMARAGIAPRVIREPNESGSGRRVNALSFHSLRHTFNSIMANAGVPEETRMALTGHTTREMNQRYTHRQLQMYVDAVAVLPRV